MHHAVCMRARIVHVRTQAEASLMAQRIAEQDIEERLLEARHELEGVERLTTRHATERRKRQQLIENYRE